MYPTFFRVSWEEPIEIDLDEDLKLYSTKPPGSGTILAFILNIIKNYNFNENTKEDSLFFHRITESLKFAYAQRSKLGDPKDAEITESIAELVKNLTSVDFAYEIFQKIDDSFTVNNASYYGAEYYTPEDHGTTHLSVLAPNGDAVSVTSTINRS